MLELVIFVWFIYFTIFLEICKFSGQIKNDGQMPVIFECIIEIILKLFQLHQVDLQSKELRFLFLRQGERRHLVV